MKRRIAFLCLVTSSVTLSNPLFRENSRFHAIKGFHGAVAAQERRAANVGRDILKRGGNAIDAAVATGFALMVTLPRAGALGGGGFMTVWLAKPKKSWVIDYREVAPQALSSHLFLNKSKNVDRIKASHSGLSVGVPGTVAGLVYAEHHYGHLGLSAVISPAIRLAQEGIPVTQSLARALRGSLKTLRVDPQTVAFFSDKKGKLVQQGDRLFRPHLAQTLLLIKQHGLNAFYRGSVARALIKTVQDRSGVMTLKDLTHYHVLVRKPLRLSFHGYDVLVPPPPSSGVTLLELLKMSTHFALHKGSINQNTAQEFHLMVEAMNFAFHDRNQFLADPAFFSVPIKTLLSFDHIQSMVARISQSRHLPSVNIGVRPKTLHEGNNTTQFSVVDSQGNMVSNTYSLNYSFGSGISVAQYGIILNNTMDDFTILPGEANAYGLVQGRANEIKGGKRPVSSMMPIIVLHHGRAWLATGSPGGSRIISTVFQLLVNLIDYHLDLATATQMPRVHSQWFPDQMTIESGISPDTVDLLRKMGHKVLPSRTQGSLQSVMHLNQLFIGFSDTRRLGAGVAAY